MWVRGLKLYSRVGDNTPTTSHPMWVRGLKQSSKIIIKMAKEVAPYVGAWIETPLQLLLYRIGLVAPYVGAWIETRKAMNKDLFPASHPMWVRGLKPLSTRQSQRWAGRTLCGCVD